MFWCFQSSISRLKAAGDEPHIAKGKGFLAIQATNGEPELHAAVYTPTTPQTLISMGRHLHENRTKYRGYTLQVDLDTQRTQLTYQGRCDADTVQINGIHSTAADYSLPLLRPPTNLPHHPTLQPLTPLSPPTSIPSSLHSHSHETSSDTSSLVNDTTPHLVHSPPTVTVHRLCMPNEHDVQSFNQDSFPAEPAV